VQCKLREGDLLPSLPSSFLPSLLRKVPLSLAIREYAVSIACLAATWVSRVPSEEESQDPPSCSYLSQLQKEKFGHFFTHLLDWDKDSLISAQDFDALSEVNSMHVVAYKSM
jgi:hypothetical protein